MIPENASGSSARGENAVITSCVGVEFPFWETATIKHT